jgi:hypothetical protein
MPRWMPRRQRLGWRAEEQRRRLRAEIWQRRHAAASQRAGAAAVAAGERRPNRGAGNQVQVSQPSTASFMLTIHMSQIAPNVISRDLTRAPRAAPERSPASPRPPVSWDMPVKTVGWVGEVRSRPRESSARPNCPDALNQIGELERFRLKTLRYTQPPMGRYWCCGMQAPMRRPEAPPDTLLGPTGPEKSPWSRSNLRLRLGIDSW